jgi:hypothetical protein
MTCTISFLTCSSVTFPSSDVITSVASILENISGARAKSTSTAYTTDGFASSSTIPLTVNFPFCGARSFHRNMHRERLLALGFRRTSRDRKFTMQPYSIFNNNAVRHENIFLLTSPVSIFTLGKEMVPSLFTDEVPATLLEQNNSHNSIIFI